MSLIANIGSVTHGMGIISQIVEAVVSAGRWIGRFFTYEYPDEIKPKPALILSELECVSRIIDEPLIDEKVEWIKPKPALIFSISECISRLLNSSILREEIIYKPDVYAMAKQEDELFLLGIH